MTHHKKKKINLNHILKDLGHVIHEVEAPIINQQNQMAKLGDKALTSVSTFSNNMILPIVVVGGVILFMQMKK